MSPAVSDRSHEREEIGHITASEREETSRGIAADDSARTVADKLGRSPFTITREIARNGGRLAYRAIVADTAAYVRARQNINADYAAESAGNCRGEAECAVVPATNLRLASARVPGRSADVGLARRYPSTTLLVEHLQRNTFPDLTGLPHRGGPGSVPIDRWGHLPFPATPKTAAEI